MTLQGTERGVYFEKEAAESGFSGSETEPTKDDGEAGAGVSIGEVEPTESGV